VGEGFGGWRGAGCGEVAVGVKRGGCAGFDTWKEIHVKLSRTKIIQNF